jgi:hypothetical protein
MRVRKGGFHIGVFDYAFPPRIFSIQLSAALMKTFIAMKHHHCHREFFEQILTGIVNQGIRMQRKVRTSFP